MTRRQSKAEEALSHQRDALKELISLAVQRRDHIQTEIDTMNNMLLRFETVIENSKRARLAASERVHTEMKLKVAR